MSDNNANFFDSRTIMAVVLVTVTFIGWQYYMQSKYPEAFKAKSQPAVEKTVEGESAETAKANAPSQVTGGQKGTTTPEVAVEAPREEKLTSFDSATLSFEISSRGMGLRNLKVKRFTDRQGNVVTLGSADRETLPLETRLMGRPEPLDFNVQQVGENLFVGRAKLGDLEITRTMEVAPEQYLFRFKISVQGNDDRFVGLTTVLSEVVLPAASSSFFLPQFERQEFYIDTSETDDRVIFAEEDLQQSWSKVQVAAIGSQYFTQAVVDKSPVMPEVKGRVDHGGKAAALLLQYPVLNKADGFKLEFDAFMGPKSHNLLSQIDSNLAQVVDFGFFNWIGRQILGLLRWFYALIGNWGVAIILLTLVVRILVLPFNIYSYKSMKAMQVIQPKIQALREKYKDDQQKQQQEMMTLMRENKVNPLGGCLPVFLQFPIFIALFQVLGHSIELYQAPFAFWINDLSLKDPYYILPVLMGITLFIQQKITPNTMDPAQAKILLMMPILFTFLMVSLPSGLTLCMFVGAVFGVLQQIYFMRDSKPLSLAVKAK